MGPSEKQRKPKLGNVNSVFVQPTLPNCQYRTGFPSTFICVQPSHAITSSQAANRAPGSRGSIQYKMNQITVRCARKANVSCRCILNCQIGRANIFRIAFCFVDRLQFAGLPVPRRLQRASGTLERLIHRSTATKTGKVILLSDFETVLKLRRMKMCTQEYIALKLWSK